MTTVGIVSPGAMGSALGALLRDGGARVVATVSGRSERTVALAEGLELLPSFADVVGASDIVLSVLPPGAAVAVATALAATAERTGMQPLVADLNAVAPRTVRDMAARLGEVGLDLVDGSISGPPPLRPGTTTIYVSGARAEEVAALPAAGVQFRVVGTEVGAASAVKMSTASFYKGQTALLTQALRAARANGVLEAVLDDLRRHEPSLVDDASRLLQSVASKSGRYVAEMNEIAASQAEAGLTPELFAAFAAVYLELSEGRLASAPPEDADPGRELRDVLDAL
jgi:3-hydroxyisobutyrate dehydrogenase-like beta-hydroxyacid dehydrogenase